MGLRTKMSDDTIEVIGSAIFITILAVAFKFELWRVRQFMTITHWGFWKSFFVLGG